mmetsp:Transcript_17584/g.53165  ORF Transcript_17584/g.53165 Transcript_17584/m.53165 type:complete len:236 (+) Transcript_17584:1676-2383(+)
MPMTGSAASTTRQTSGSPKMNISDSPHARTQTKRPADASFSPFIDWMSVTLSPRNCVSSPAELLSSSKKPTSIVSHLRTELERKLRVRCSPAMPKPLPSRIAAVTSSRKENMSRMPQGHTPCALTSSGLTVNGMMSILEKSTPMQGHTAAAMNMPMKPERNHQRSFLSCMDIRRFTTFFGAFSAFFFFFDFPASFSSAVGPSPVPVDCSFPSSSSLLLEGIGVVVLALCCALARE